MKHYTPFNKKYHNEINTFERPEVNYLGVVVVVVGVGGGGRGLRLLLRDPNPRLQLP